MTKQAVEEFKKLYLEHYGVTLTDADAVEKARSLLNLYRVIFSTSDNEKSANNE